MQQELRRLQRTLGITFILVTHDQEEALIMSDRIAVMFDGNIEQLGRPQEIYERPVSKRVASFIGVMNFIEGEYIGRKGKQLKVRADALGEVLLEQEQMPTEIEPGQVTIGLRPEMMTVLYHKSDKSEKEFNATVENVDYYGDMTYYTVTLPKSDDQVTISMRNTAGRHVYEIGDKVRIGWGSASMVILV